MCNLLILYSIFYVSSIKYNNLFMFSIIFIFIVLSVAFLIFCCYANYDFYYTTSNTKTIFLKLIVYVLKIVNIFLKHKKYVLLNFIFA